MIGRPKMNKWLPKITQHGILLNVSVSPYWKKITTNQ
jgi:hypothetical protein